MTLYALYAIQRRRGALRAVRRSQLAAEAPLVRALEPLGGPPALAPALDRAIARGSLIVAPLDDGDALYAINDEGGRRTLARVRSGALPLPDGRVPVAAPPGERRPAAVVYEQEVGTLTPAVAEALARAAERYPAEWIADALRLAATHNRRSWAYVEAILRRWDAEGRDDGTTTGADRGAAGDDEAGGGDAAGADPYARIIRRSWP